MSKQANALNKLPRRSTKSRAVIRREGGASRAYDPMLFLCLAYHLPEPVCEHRFDINRKWRFDWAWPDEQVAVEQEGGIWTNGRHTRGRGFLNDLEKYNHAALLGWKVFRFTPQQIAEAEPVAWTLERALKDVG